MYLKGGRVIGLSIVQASWAIYRVIIRRDLIQIITCGRVRHDHDYFGKYEATTQRQLLTVTCLFQLLIRGMRSVLKDQDKRKLKHVEIWDEASSSRVLH